MHKGFDARRAFAFLLTRAGIAAVCALLSLAVFARFSAEIHHNDRLTRCDTIVLNYFGAHQMAGIREVMEVLTFVAGPKMQPLVLLLCLVYFLWRKERAAVLTLLLADVAGAGVVSGLKAVFHRPRPEAIFAPLGYSFPSGHSFFAVVVYGLTAYFLARQQKTRKRKNSIYAVGGALIVLVGFSRIYLGQHYPSDVGAGYVSGFFWDWFCIALPPFAWQQWQNRRAKRLDAPMKA